MRDLAERKNSAVGRTVRRRSSKATSRRSFFTTSIGCHITGVGDVTSIATARASL